MELKIMSSEKFFMCLTAIFLVLAPVFWLYTNLEYNLRVNLFTGFLFMGLTVFSLSWLAEKREKREWKNVEKWVMCRLGRELYKLFNILGRFIYPKVFRSIPSEGEFWKF